MSERKRGVWAKKEGVWAKKEGVWAKNAFFGKSEFLSQRKIQYDRDQAVADAQADEELTVLKDSLSSMQELESLQRRDFPEWIHGYPA